jgi:penicillin-binding protein 1A
MQSRKLPRDETGEDSRAANAPPSGAPEPSETPLLTALPASILLKVLARRIARSAREKAAGFIGALARLRSRMPNLAAPPPPPAPQSATEDAAEAGTTLPAQARIAAMLRNGRSALARMSPRTRCAVAVAIVLVAIPVAYLAYCVATIPFAGGATAQAAPSAMVFEAADGRPFAARGILKGDGLSADHIPPLLASAVISIEDRRFYDHGGIDLRAIARAGWHDLAGRGLQGGSTITQQLARRLYLSPDRTLKRKVQEAALAEWLEFRLSKNQILARYLNTAYFGDGAYGVDSAAHRYFDKSVQQLSLGEAAMLAGLIRAPSQLDPDRNPARAQERTGVVLDAMVKNGAISQPQADAARQEPVVLRGAPDVPPGNNYFLDTAAAEVKSQTGPSTQDLTVRTTLDPELQRIAESVVARRLATDGKAKNVSQAALVAMAPDGAILAMVGGRDYNDSQFNRVTQARRQPGSLFKAFVYLSALRKGYTPDSVVVDQPVSVGDWEPENYGDHYFGPVTLRTAFAHSLNSVAVQLAQSVGIQTVIDTAKQAGVRSDLPAVPSVALGSGAVTPLEMTRAFAAIATNSTGIDGYAVREIDQGGRTLYARPAQALAAADNPAIHAEMLDLLSSVVRGGTGAAARLDRPSGGKTGTSEDYRDAWFVGFTSDLVVGVWVGNDDNSPMNGVVGGSIPATIWRDFVSAAETVRRPQAATALNVAQSGPTISFNTVGAVGDEPERNPYGSGGRRPFRLFWFRF